jgi:site-specific recombinase XerD
MTESRDGVVSSPTASIDLPIELIRRYREDCEIRGMSPKSLRRYVSSLKIYNRYLQEHNIDLLNVDRNVLRSFLEYLRKDRNVGLKTIGNYFTSMAMFYEFLEYEGYVDKNPVYSVRKRYIRRYKDNDEVRCGN